MKFEFYSLEQGQETFALLQEAYKNFYRNDPSYMKIFEHRSKNKGDEFYKKIKTDIHTYLSSEGYSASRLWEFFHLEYKRTSGFEVARVELIYNLINFYTDNVYDPSEKKAIPEKASIATSNNEPSTVPSKEVIEDTDGGLIFTLDKSIQLKKIFSSYSSKNIGRQIVESIKALGHYFESKGLPLEKNKNNLNKIFSLDKSFSFPAFNSLVCFLLFTSIHNKWDKRNFIIFNKSLVSPPKPLNETTLEMYNAVLKKIIIQHTGGTNFRLILNDQWQLNYKILARNKRKRILLVSFIICFLAFSWGLSWYLSQNKDDGSTILKTPVVRNCIFSPDSTKHQILILPFKYIEGEIWTEDKGYILTQRLDSLNLADNLNLEVKFCRNIKPTEYDEMYYRKIKETHNANHIIYGFLDKGESCLSGERTCLNYITDYSRTDNMMDNFQVDRSNASFKKVDNIELAQGKLQENMEYLMYFNAMLASHENFKYDMVIHYSNYLLNQNLEHNGVVHFYRGFSYYQTYKHELSIIEFLKSLEYNINKKAEAHEMIAWQYHLLNQLGIAKYHYEKALSYDRSNISSGLLYDVNSELGLHRANIELMNRMMKIKPEKKFQYIYWRGCAKKLQGDIAGFIKDSTFVENYFKEHPLARGATNFVTPLLPAAQVKTAREHILAVLVNPRLFSGVNKNIDSLKVDLCRIKAIDPDYYEDKIRDGATHYGLKKILMRDLNININDCENILDKVFEYEKKYMSRDPRYQ